MSRFSAADIEAVTVEWPEGAHLEVPSSLPTGDIETPAETFLVTLPSTESGGERWSSRYWVSGPGGPGGALTSYTFDVRQVSRRAANEPSSCNGVQIERDTAAAVIHVCFNSFKVRDEIANYWRNVVFTNDLNEVTWLGDNGD